MIILSLRLLPHSYFSKLGYPTLSIDRLGAGLSDHPYVPLTARSALTDEP